jgi:hypothetical protein
MLALSQLWWPVSRGNGGSFLPVTQKTNNGGGGSFKNNVTFYGLSQTYVT